MIGRYGRRQPDRLIVAPFSSLKHFSARILQYQIIHFMKTAKTTINLPGIHHVTAIAGDPKRNVDFYTGVLGLRLVKQTVNSTIPPPITSTMVTP